MRVSASKSSGLVGNGARLVAILRNLLVLEKWGTTKLQWQTILMFCEARATGALDSIHCSG
jgi:hypothetical protein